MGNIVCAPLAMLLPNIAPLVQSLIRLYNFCIEESNTGMAPVQSKVVESLVRNVKHSWNTGSTDFDLVTIGKDGRPTSLLGQDHHFAGAGTANRNHC